MAPKKPDAADEDKPCREDKTDCSKEAESAKICLQKRYNACIQDFGIKTAAGFILGTMVSSFFLRGNLAKWPKFVFGGLGFGMAYSNCENSLNEYLLALSPKLCTVKKRP